MLRNFLGFAARHLALKQRVGVFPATGRTWGAQDCARTSARRVQPRYPITVVRSSVTAG
jgi:hypothetical protein